MSKLLGDYSGAITPLICNECVSKYPGAHIYMPTRFSTHGKNGHPGIQGQIYIPLFWKYK